MAKIGTITHYYDKLGVGIVKLDKALKKGDTIKITGGVTDFEQEVAEMQFDHKELATGKKGQDVGIKMDEKLREGDKVTSA